MNTQDSLKKAFCEGLNLPASTDFETLAYAQSAYWDSIGHMKLIAAIEEAFDIMLDTDDVIGMSSFSVAKDILRKYEINIG